MNLNELNIPNSLPEIIKLYKQFKRDIFEKWCVLHCDEIYRVKDNFVTQIISCSKLNDSKSSVRVCIGAIVLSHYSNARLETCAKFLANIPPPRDTAASDFITRYIAKFCKKVKLMGNFLTDQLKVIRNLLQPNKSKAQIYFAKKLLHNLAIYATHAIDSCVNKFYETVLDEFQNSNLDVRLEAFETLKDYFKYTRQKQYPPNLFNHAIQLVKQPNPSLHNGVLILIALIDYFPEYFYDLANGLLSFAINISKNDKTLCYTSYFLQIAIVSINQELYNPSAQDVIKQVWPSNDNQKLSNDFLQLLIFILRKCPMSLCYSDAETSVKSMLNQSRIDSLIKIIKNLLTTSNESNQKNGSELLHLFMKNLPVFFSDKYEEISDLILKAKFTKEFVKLFQKIITEHPKIWENIIPSIGEILIKLLDERKSILALQIITFVPDIPEDYTNQLIQRVQHLFYESESEFKKNLPPSILALAEIIDKHNKKNEKLTSLNLGTQLISNAMISESWEMRLAILNSFKPPYHAFLSYPNILDYFAVLVNDESPQVKKSALRILSGIAPMNPEMIYPMFRRIFLDILFICSTSKSMKTHSDVTEYLPILFSNLHDIVPIYGPVFIPIFINYMQIHVTKAQEIIESKPSKNTELITSIQESSFALQSMSAAKVLLTTSQSESLGGKIPILSSYSFNSVSASKELLHQKHIIDEQMTFFDHIFATKITINYVRAIGCICKSNFDLVRPNLNEIMDLLIKNINATGQKKVLLATLSTIKIIVEQLGPKEAIKIDQLIETLMNTGSRLISKTVHSAIFKILGRIGPAIPNSKDLISEAKIIENIDLSMPCDDYFVSVVKNSLDSILDDKSESSLHYLAHQALTKTFSTCNKSSNSQRLFNSYLTRLINTIISLSTDERPAFFSFLETILADCPIEWLQNFSQDFYELIDELWNTENQIDIIKLIPKLLHSLKDKFSPYIPKIVPTILAEINICYENTKPNLSSKISPENKMQSLLKVLSSLSKFASNFIYLIIEQICTMILNDKSQGKFVLYALDTLRSIIQNFNCSSYSSILFRTCFFCFDNFPVYKFSIYQVLYSLFISLSSELNLDRYYELLERNKLMNSEINQIRKSLSSSQTPFIFLEEKGKLNFQNNPSKNNPVSFSDFDFIIVDPKENEKKQEEEFLTLNEDEINNSIQIQSINGTNEQWKSWIRSFVRIFITQSPNPAIHSCSQISNKSYLFSRKIFNAAFLSCWKLLSKSTKTNIKTIISMPLASDTVPMSVITVLIGLIEFTERSRQPIEESNNFNRTKSALRAEKPTYALHCAQLDFDSQSEHSIGNINQVIQAYSQLGMYDEVKGVNKIIGQFKKNKWKENNIENILSKLEKNEKWDEIVEYFQSFKTISTPEKRHASLIFSHAFLHLKRRSEFEQAISECPPTHQSNILKCMFEIVDNTKISLVENKIKGWVKDGFKKLGLQGGPLFSHGFTAVSPFIVSAQQLVELREYAIKHDTSRWDDRLKNVNCHFATIEPLLHTRMEILRNKEDQKSIFLSYLKIARKSNEWESFERFYDRHFSRDQYDVFAGYEYLHLLWRQGFKEDALNRIDKLLQNPTNDLIYGRLFYKKAKWLARTRNYYSSQSQQMFEVKHLCEESLKIRIEHYPTRNLWAWACMRIFDLTDKGKNRSQAAIDAISGFARCVMLDFKDTFFDLLQMSSILFRSTSLSNVFEEVEEIIKKIELKKFTKIIPQLMIYKHTHSNQHRQFILQILSSLLIKYPNSVIFSLLFAQHFSDYDKEICDLMNTFKMGNSGLYLASDTVLNGLQDSCLTYTEFIYEGLSNIFNDAKEKKLNNLLEYVPIFLNRIKNPKCPYDRQIISKYGDKINFCIASLEKFLQDQNCNQLLNSSKLEWNKFTGIIVNEVYLQVKLSLKAVAPDLNNINTTIPSITKLSVFNTFEPEKPVIGISQFCDDLRIKQTKQRPRKLKIIGTDGKVYNFLLKGHEDLRQDQRVMQFFELMNSIASSSLPQIIMTGVTPLTPNVGVIQWIAKCDTIHQLIVNAREISNLPCAEVESQMIMKKVYGDHVNTIKSIDTLMPIQRYEVFRKVEVKTRERRLDLRDAMWIKAQDAESWVKHIVNFSKTSALMSIVGYIIGLGDRHPGNIMIQRMTGNVVHIDFGDCFEVTKERAQLAETIPFRLTRNIIATLGPCSIEGSFRRTFEEGIRVIRDRREAVMSILEIFIREPITSGGFFEPLPKNEVISGSVEINDLVSRSSALERLKDQISRISEKINGLDFENDTPLTVSEQTDALIKSATDTYNLSCLYHGWNPLW